MELQGISVLPNIWGYFDTQGGGGGADIPPIFNTSGSFTGIENISWGSPKIVMNDDGRTKRRIQFSASKSNTIYGNGDTVQPNSTRVSFVIKY